MLLHRYPLAHLLLRPGLNILAWVLSAVLFKGLAALVCWVHGSSPPPWLRFTDNHPLHWVWQGAILLGGLLLYERIQF